MLGMNGLRRMLMRGLPLILCKSLSCLFSSRLEVPAGVCGNLL